MLRGPGTGSQRSVRGTLREKTKERRSVVSPKVEDWARTEDRRETTEKEGRQGLRLTLPDLLPTPLERSVIP